jgi:GMP synthase-like glutamine amidotransferase
MSAHPRVLVLDNAVHRSDYLPFDHWQRAVGDAAQLVRAPREEPPPDELGGYTHVIVTGSEASILDDDPWVPPQVELLRRAGDLGLPILGSCHGHQMVALAFGGEVGKAAEPELGWSPLDVDRDDPMFALAEHPVWVFSSHFDEVRALPDDMVVVASTPRCAIHAFHHRTRPIWGVQSHPEIDPEEGQALLDAFAALDPRVAEIPVDHPARDSGYIHALIRGFLRLER